MRYALVSYSNINSLPYAVNYIQSILRNGNECDLIFWDRDAADGEKEARFGCKVHPFNYKITPNTSHFEKLRGYIGAVWHANFRLMIETYDRVVFLETHSAVTSLIPAIFKYRDRYVIEIRDFTFENKAAYRLLEKTAITNAMKCVISSEAYQRFLPTGNYLIAHNISCFETKSLLRARARIGTDVPYIIAFVGTVRFIQNNIKLLKLFANNPSFKLAYFGSGSEVLKEYCEKTGISNVQFGGSFLQEETLEQYDNVAVINNVYGNDSPYLDFALSNKLYHSAQLRIPITVSPGTFMEEVANKYGIGFALDINDPNAPDALFNWLNSIDRAKFKDACDFF